jgi:hypothetical protein
LEAVRGGDAPVVGDLSPTPVQRAFSDAADEGAAVRLMLASS